MQGRYAEIQKQGLGLVAISYDSPETLKSFATSRGISFPLISDAASAIIRRYGILNDQQKAGTPTYGIPHPGTIVVDRNGVVTGRFFEDAYQERYTAAAMLAAQGTTTAGTALTAETTHLNLRATVSDSTLAPGQRVSIVIDVTPRPGMHVYAPGKHNYQVVRLTIDQQPWLRAHDTRYPPSEVYHFRPLDERVEAYLKPFRLMQDVTIVATPEIQKLLAGMSTVTIAGAIEYQACDDQICYNPVRIPISFTLPVTPLDRPLPR